jgi:cell division transport system permease protein
VIPPVLSALRRTAGIAARRPRAALWTLLALSCALFVVGIVATAALAIDRWAAAHPPGGGNLVVYLGEDIDEDRASELVGELRTLRGVESAELVSAAASAIRLGRALGSDPALLDATELASLPASVEVKLAPGVRDVVAMSPTVRALRGAPGVADLVVEDGGDDRLPAVLGSARALAWSGAALFAGLALFMALAAVRLRLDRPPHEATVLRLLGAPPGFIAIPCALAGALLGAAAGVVAGIALGLVLHGLAGTLATTLAEPSLAAVAALVGLGALVGLIGGGLAGVARAP